MIDSRSGGRHWPAVLYIPALLLASLFAPSSGLVAAASANPAAVVQRKGQPEEVPEVDPYTQGDRGALDRLGYVSFGPFPFGDGHDSPDVEKVLGGITVLWVETAHFRIGCTLEPFTVAQDSRERAKIKAELTRLRKRLPDVKPKTRELDRWLQLHLWAQRLEELYAEFSAAVGVTDADFASGGTQGAASPLGAGPYLGQKSKYTVLLLQKLSGLGRYSSQFIGHQADLSQRWYFHEVGTLFFGTAREAMRGTYANDTGLHCAVVNGVTQNLVDGFRAYSFQSPEWWKHGVAHVLSRRIDPRFNVFGGGLGSHGQKDDGWKWEPRVRGRVKHDYFPSWEKMFGWTKIEDLKDPDHMIAWSRVQFLLEDPQAARSFMVALKEPIAYGTDPQPLLVKRQTEAIPASWGASLEELEAAWAEWVEDNYPKR